MPTEHVIAVDLARVYSEKTKGRLLTTLAWGEDVELKEIGDSYVEVRMTRYLDQPDGSIKPVTSSGFIRPSASSGIDPAEVVRPKTENDVLKVAFVDVQQGDGMVIETPKGKVLLVDGGDNQLFARYLAGRYRGTTPEDRQAVEAIVVTHGDADHFLGLTEIRRSETLDRLDKPGQRWKRIHIQPRRVFHNGLVKRPGKRADGSSRPESQLLGATRKIGEVTVITGLEENLLGVDDEVMNSPFRAWKRALEGWSESGGIEFRRLSEGDHDAFDFLAEEDVEVRVLGPLLTRGEGITGLRFLGEPPKGPRLDHESLALETDGFKGKSASHTINGHSIVLRLRYGGFSFLLSGDLNDQAERHLVAEARAGRLELRSEVFKVPHHGSADFSGAFIKEVSPIVSVVSSGDESARKEYIHPRATLMGALGRHSRIEEPLIFVTELVAFFEVVGYVQPEKHKHDSQGETLVADGKAVELARPKKTFFAFQRTAFGLVKVHTDGRRLLVYTNSGQTRLKEAYAYRLDLDGTPVPDPVRQA